MELHVAAAVIDKTKEAPPWNTIDETWAFSDIAAEPLDCPRWEMNPK